MSILTKIFVVLATVLSLLLVPLLVTFAQQSQVLKTTNINLQTKLDVADAEAALRTTQAKEAQAALANLSNESTKTKEALTNQISAQQTQLADKEAAITGLQGQVAEAQARFGELSSAQKLSAALLETLNTEVKDLRARNLTFRTRNIELSDRVNELTTENDSLVHNVRLVKEKLAALEEAAAAATAQPQQVVDTGAPATQTNKPAGVPVRGMITAVQQVGDVMFVAVNIGTNDQVSPGMEFMIHEGDKFVGSVTITKVDLNSAAGRVTLAQAPVKANQEVLAGF